MNNLMGFEIFLHALPFGPSRLYLMRWIDQDIEIFILYIFEYILRMTEWSVPLSAEYYHTRLQVIF